MSGRPLIKESLWVLNLCGLNSANKSFWARIRTFVSIILMMYWVIELFLQCVFNWKGWNSTEAIMVLGAASQGLTKGIYILINSKKIITLLENLEKFPCLDGLDLNFQLKMQYLTKSATKTIKIFYLFTLSTLTSFLLKPLVVAGKTLPFETYHSTFGNQKFSYELMYFLQVFQGLAAQISALKIIKKRFSKMSVSLDFTYDEDCLKEVGQIVDHHNLVLRCIKILDSIYAFYLLIQFSSSTGLICSAMLGIVASGFPPTLEDVSRYVSFLASVLIQLFVYCTAGTYLMTECESVAEVVYDLKWWAKPQPKFRRACVMIIQRANKIERLTAGGMFTLDLENFTNVVKLGLSVFSLAQAITKGN